MPTTAKPVKMSPTKAGITVPTRSRKSANATNITAFINMIIPAISDKTKPT